MTKETQRIIVLGVAAILIVIAIGTTVKGR